MGFEPATERLQRRGHGDDSSVTAFESSLSSALNQRPRDPNSLFHAALVSVNSEPG